MRSSCDRRAECLAILREFCKCGRNSGPSLESLLRLESREVWGAGKRAGTSKHLVSPVSFPISFPGSAPCPSAPPRAKQTAAAVPQMVHEGTVGFMGRQASSPVFQ